MGGSFSDEGSAPVPGLNMNTNEFVRRLQRHRRDLASEPDPRNLLTPNSGFDMHNGVRGPLRPGRDTGAAGADVREPDKSWQLDAVVGHVAGRSVTLRELQEAERRRATESGPRLEVLNLAHASFSASKTVGPWSATPKVVYTAHE